MIKIACLIFLSTIVVLQCQPSNMLSNYIEVQTGLKSEHLEERPLLELEYHQPEADKARIQRVYEDGSLYFFVVKDDEMSWVYITKIKEQGMVDLRFITHKYCRSYDPNPAQEVGKGLFIYRISDDNLQKEISVRGVNYGKYPKLQNIDNIINGNMEPIKQ